MTWAYMYVMGFFFIGYTYKFNRQLLRLDIKALAKWLVFIAVNCLIKYFLFKIPAFHEFLDIKSMSYIPWYYMVLAGFEEAMFTLPMYYAMQYSDNKYIRAILMASLACVFASGHIYQGAIAVIPTFTYMFFIAPVFMKRFGFYTMVLGHISFDLSIWALIKFTPFLNLLDYSLYSCKIP